MKQLSFSNFRRFEYFPPLAFGDITFLVGGNNCGKSTLVKALLLTFDNLRHIRNSHKNGSKGRKNHISHTKRSFNNREK